MNTAGSIAIAGMLLLLSACGDPYGNAPEASTSAAEAPDPFASPDGVVADPSTVAATGEATPCAGADMELTDARRKAYPALVADAVREKVEPETVELIRFMRIGAWSAMYAAIPIADPGWFVFETTDGRQRFKDVWGGDADEDDRQGLVEWATGLGAPVDFAACFAETVID